MCWKFDWAVHNAVGSDQRPIERKSREMNSIGREIGVQRCRRAPDRRWNWPSSYSTDAPAMWANQSPSQFGQLRKRVGGEQSRGVLGRPAVARLDIASQSIGHYQSMLTDGPGAGADAVDKLLMFALRRGLVTTAVGSKADALKGWHHDETCSGRPNPGQLLLLSTRQL